MHRKYIKGFCVSLLVVLTVFVSYAQGADSSTEPYPVELQVGAVFKVCESGEVICPVIVPICDDLKVVDVVDTPDGLGFKGISLGATLCSVMSTTDDGMWYGARRVFRITVR